MKRKLIKRLIAVVAIPVVLFASFKIENLQVYQAQTRQTTFDADEFANRFWNEKLAESIENAPDADQLLKLLNENQEAAFRQYGKKLGISKTAYFTLKGFGIIDAVNDEFISVATIGGNTVELETAFIFGNAVRDGSGQVNIDKFVNMTDFNKVSIAVNQLVRKKVTSHLTQAAQKGQAIEFCGMAEQKEDEPFPASLRIIPVKAIISDGKTE
ncbi:DUF2291 family protein [Gaoshiqia sediminis]|uniref:DUF2291 domain-containing protein n=1 Tax=Gaoshiqia sediminis TaxID=2986998 RepID=A0AA41Y9M4_9BACT|nr:DUF2291 family protein [Gaoshiqia sediminis]MCW0481780.1 DUF2291 domain-containing protein [Gaoshiqia sediminis]